MQQNLKASGRVTSGTVQPWPGTLRGWRKQKRQECGDRLREILRELITRRWKHRVASGSWRGRRQDRDGERNGKPHGSSLSLEAADDGVEIRDTGDRDYVIKIQIVVA